MAQRPRKRQPKGRTFVTVETENGPILHKLCAGPCERVKPVTDFRRKGATWRSWCKVCEKPRERAYWLSEVGKGKRRAAVKRRRAAGIKQKRWGEKQDCVYIVQIISRVNVLKIGRTNRLAPRVSNLKQRYGELRLLYVIPTETPIILEGQLHAQLKAFRLYEGAKKTELFQFDTKARRQAFHKATTPYSAYVVAHPTWSVSPQEHDDVQQRFAFA